MTEHQSADMTSMEVGPNLLLQLDKDSLMRRTRTYHIRLRFRENPGPAHELGTTVLLRNDELRTLALCGVGADPHGGACWLDQVLHINVPEGKFMLAYGEFDPL